MYDTLYPSELPRGAKLIASYVGDGRTGYASAKQICPDAVSINESPGDPAPADVWADEQDVVTASGLPKRGYTDGAGWSAAQVAKAIATGRAKGAYGTPGPGFGLAKIQAILTRRYHVPRSRYVLWSDGLVGRHRTHAIPAGTDANQSAIRLGNGSYDRNDVTAAFLTRLGLTVPRTQGST
ncbi:MAG: hypothetical protein J2O48_09185 [Solirubrobacterales bacterium]|nr:hypothetical protein [Solirubrobacterales bacterium]